MSCDPTQTRKARLQDLVRRTDRVLAILHAPTAAHGRIMEQAGCDAAFIGTGAGLD